MRESHRPRASWRLITDDGASAAEGLALDEALMAGYARDAAPRPPTLRLYSYRTHCALVGRYQNLTAEVDLDACTRTGTQVSRRPTGGGAIVMGSGQLGVALIGRVPADRQPRRLIADLSQAIIAGLAELGITAEFRGKNDLEAGRRKIAGLGIYIDNAGAMLFHASVLADLDVPFMLDVLRIPAAKLAGKAVAAVEERVTTVSRETGHRHDAASLREFVALGFAKTFGIELEVGEPEAAELARMAELATERYAAPSWLNERSNVPDGSGSAVLRTPVGLTRVYVETKGDLIKHIMVVGDFNELPPALVELESALRWKRLDGGTVVAAINAAGADTALGVSAGRFSAAVIEAGAQAGKRAAAAPVRSVGSCYFPDQS